ncbi:MAG: hypothetical protein PHG16_03340 [Lachnospiraceae bacterium]|nr:hypothetical protein [Lachnospiraceae bacterium]
MKDKFREWLSDNLRYILLGVAILIVLVLVFFGVRLLSGVMGNSGKNQTTSNSVKVVTTTPTDTPEATDTPAADTPQATETPVPTEAALTKDSNAELQNLFSNYYTSLGNKDIPALKTMVDNLTEADQAQIENDTYIEGYSDVATYTFDGPTDGTYVVIASYNCKYRDIDTKAPGLNQMYVSTDANGKLVIAGGTVDEAISAYMTDITNREEVKKLITDTQNAYQAALASDEKLSALMASVSQ